MKLENFRSINLNFSTADPSQDQCCYMLQNSCLSVENEGQEFAWEYKKPWPISGGDLVLVVVSQCCWHLSDDVFWRQQYSCWGSSGHIGIEFWSCWGVRSQWWWCPSGSIGISVVQSQEEELEGISTSKYRNMVQDHSLIICCGQDQGHCCIAKFSNMAKLKIY